LRAKHRVLWLAAGAVLVGLGVGACGWSASGDGVDANATDSSVSGEVGTPAAAPGCAVAPASLVSSTLGVQVSEPSEITNASVTACTYLSGGGGSTVIVRYQTEENATTFAAGRHGFEESGQATTAVTGFMDEAYSSSSEFGDAVTNTLVARKGSVEILVTAVAPIDAEKALIQKIFDSLA
jgi:hypothetical protein